MRVMVMVRATKSSEAGELPDEELLAEMSGFNEELVKAGIMTTGDGLKPSSEGCRIRFRGSNRVVTDGPFVETNELIAGYWLWNVESMEGAIDWAKRRPNPMPEDSDLEIRPLFGMEDFADADPDRELRDHEQRLRDAVSLRDSSVQPYLFFGGRCEEALGFYKTALGASVGMMMRFSESPDPLPERMLQPGFEERIMHAEFTVGKMTLMASDG